MKCPEFCPRLWWWTEVLLLGPRWLLTSRAALRLSWTETKEEVGSRLCRSALRCPALDSVFGCGVPPQLLHQLSAASRVRRFCGGRGRKVWPSCRMCSWWMASWWCRGPASTTSTHRHTSDTHTHWRMQRKKAKRRGTEGDPCCSTFIKRWAFVRFFSFLIPCIVFTKLARPTCLSPLRWTPTQFPSCWWRRAEPPAGPGDPSFLCIPPTRGDCSRWGAATASLWRWPTPPLWTWTRRAASSGHFSSARCDDLREGSDESTFLTPRHDGSSTLQLWLLEKYFFWSHQTVLDFTTSEVKKTCWDCVH